MIDVDKYKKLVVQQDKTPLLIDCSFHSDFLSGGDDQKPALFVRDHPLTLMMVMDMDVRGEIRSERERERKR